MAHFVAPESFLKDMVAFLEQRLDALPARPFNYEDHIKNVQSVVELMEVLEEIVPEAMDLNGNGEAFRAYRQMYDSYSGLSIQLLKSTQGQVKIENDVCHICLEEQAIEPMYCLQCLKVVGCTSCINEFVSHNETVVKCPNCQRKSQAATPLFGRLKQ
ncbi:unnamed protein product [Bursaphelenchus xylophilus]|uniref:(pine wood nematode) hypothetical protein n=1 Tax=Bursaphelenchus xylophilus TaxID=6326 RepID=A0A1I7SFD7_BURXY|nr:unnamed protein product [Bursaphelenchus xylophilus]CAG9092803.1 unnamed protein product [Bursaphelenchus xylophilus]